MKSMRGKRSEDLIFSGTHSVARSNRASVAIVFDNTKRTFNLDFDEVVVERAVFRDGMSEYAINGSKVRLRDIHELLAGANIGESAHHIISQGEADRILLASPRARREMLEDALGLKVYEFKKQEASRKLGKTEDNISQVEALRREVAPHVRFLKKQVERLNRAKELRNELTLASQKYFAIEDTYLDKEYAQASALHAQATARLTEVSEELVQIKKNTVHDEEGERRINILRKLELSLERVNAEYATLLREVGHVDGTLSAIKSRVADMSRDTHVRISRNEIAILNGDIEKCIRETGDGVEALKSAINKIRNVVSTFFDRFTQEKNVSTVQENEEIQTLMKEKVVLMEREAVFSADSEKLRNAVTRAREDVVAYEESAREEKHQLLERTEIRVREEATVTRMAMRLSEIAARRDVCEQDKGDLLALVGSSAVSYEPLMEVSDEDLSAQKSRRHEIERLKIRLEETGGTGEDIRKEYEDSIARENFLTNELEDLTNSAQRLRALISDLDEELTKTFIEGLERVNETFGNFFSLMFGGGSAELTLEDVLESDIDEDNYKEQDKSQNIRAGIDISVHMPKKRVQTLTQLSGGERALTSIALIFAMSRVNPPPFLILDETDAALDEANSRRYGDMIESLAKQSQLIVITHNRETMSRASVLYGVTMSGDGVSKLLSIKFDEAVSVAK